MESTHDKMASSPRPSPPEEERERIFQTRSKGPDAASVLTALCFWLLPASDANAEDADKPTPDKSGYNLFRPTPPDMMREMSADRPDKTDCPFTVDAGHFQVEMDFANFTSDAPKSQNGNVRSEGWQLAPMNLKLGVLNDLDLQLVLAPYQWQRARDKSSGA